jgi:hypothetical protein
VAPFKTSLTSSGLFIMIAKNRIIFLIGIEYFNCYLNDDNFEQTSALLSEDLLNKLIYFFDSANLTYEEAAELNEDKVENSVFRKTVFCVEGHEDYEINEYLEAERIKFAIDDNFDSGSSDSDDEKFFTPFENQLTIGYWLP